MTAYTLSSTHAAILEQLEEMRRARAGIDQLFYTADTRNERVISRIIDGPASELIPPGRGRSSTRGMRP